MEGVAPPTISACLEAYLLPKLHWLGQAFSPDVVMVVNVSDEGMTLLPEWYSMLKPLLSLMDISRICGRIGHASNLCKVMQPSTYSG